LFYSEHYSGKLILLTWRHW